MKYLLICLLLAVPRFTGSSGPVKIPTRLDVDASFTVAMSDGVIDAFVTVAEWSDRARVALHMDEASPQCSQEGACGPLLLSGDGRRFTPLADVVITRDLQMAAIHTAVPFADNVSRRTFTVRIDLNLRATGDFHPSDGSGRPGYVNAIATGIVASTDTTFVGPAQVSTRGMITRSALP